MHTIDVEPDPTSPQRTSRSTLWLWAAAVAVLAVAVVAAVLWWPSSLSDEPPWGLDQIDMPNTEADVIAGFEAMPVIDGHQPTLSMMGQGDLYPTATYYESEEGGFGVEIQAFADDDLHELISPDVMEGWNIEGFAVEPDSELIWVAAGPAPEDEVDAFAVLWADPDGSWRFHALADTAEFRTKLVHAFVEAANQ